MATGFEKLKDKVLDESPLQILTKEQKEAREAKAGQTPERPRAEARVRPVKGVQKEEKVTITIQVSPEVKFKLDEMKFRSKKKIWELTEEAITDLYEKTLGK